MQLCCCQGAAPSQTASDGQPQGGGRRRRLFSAHAELQSEGATSEEENVETETKPKKGSTAMGDQEARVPRLGPVQGVLGRGVAVCPGEAGGDRGAGLRVRAASQADAGQVAPGGAGWPACQAGTLPDPDLHRCRQRASPPLRPRWVRGTGGLGAP